MTALRPCEVVVQAFNKAKFGVAIIDKQSKILASNPIAVKMSLEEHLLDSLDNPSAMKVKSALAGNIPENSRVEVQFKTGQAFSLKISPLDIDDKEFWLCQFTEASEDKRVIAQLRQAAHLQKALVSHIPEVTIYLMNTELEYVAIEGGMAGNESTQNLIGTTAYELDSLTKDDHKQFISICEQALAGKESDAMILKMETQGIILDLQAVPVLDDQGLIEFVVVVSRDVTEHKKILEELSKAANHDVLTGLPNRKFFYEKIHSITTGKHACLLFDLDGFKQVNDTYGHDVGDQLLKRISNRAKHTLGEIPIARLGGDEFVVLVSKDKQGIEEVVHDLISVIEQPYTINNKEISVKISMGASWLEGDVDSTMKAADRAMYKIKENGGGFSWHE